MITDLPESNSSSQPLQPTPTSSIHIAPRLASLDTLRGIGILGALFISIWYFGGFNNNQQNGLLLQSKGLNYRLWGTVELLFDGKMRALISFVFGAGMVLYLSKKNAEEVLPASDLFIRRQMWLIAFGLVNAMLFLWPGDMLFHLGIMGILLFPFVRLSARGLLIAAVIATLIFCGKNYWNYADDLTAYSKFVAVTKVEKKISKDSLAAAQKKIAANNIKKDTLTKQQKDDKAAWEGIVKNKKPDPKKNDEGVKEMRNGSYWKIWNHLLQQTQWREARWTYQTGVWDFAGMILLGMALYKFGFFDAGFSGKKYFLLALAGLAGGLLLGWYRLQYNQYVLQDYTKYIIGHRLPYNIYFPFERALLALSYASLVMLMMRAGFLKFLWWVFARVGQMALSNYLLQSVLCMIFFTGIFMGYFGRLEQYQLYLVVMELWVVQIVFSILWLRYYIQGPAEWLLRCLLYKKWLPNKIHLSVNPAASTTALS